MIEDNDSKPRPMGLLSKLFTLARISRLPQDSPARVLYQAHLSQDALHSAQAGKVKTPIDPSNAALCAIGFCILLTIFITDAGSPARLFGWTADIGCMGILSPADPRECSRSYGAVAKDSMSPEEWDAALGLLPKSLAWRFSVELLNDDLVVLAAPANEAQLLAKAKNQIRNQAQASGEELGALGSQLLGAIVAQDGQDGMAKTMERAKELATRAALLRSTPPETPMLATVSSPRERARLRQLGEQSKTQSRKDAFEAAIGKMMRKEDFYPAFFAAMSCCLLGAIAIGALARFSLAIRRTTSREHRALHVAFEYFELVKNSKPSRMGQANGNGTSRPPRRL